MTSTTRTSMRTYRTLQSQSSRRISRPSVRRQFAGGNEHQQRAAHYAEHHDSSENLRNWIDSRLTSALLGGSFAFVASYLVYTVARDDSASHSAAHAKSHIESRAEELKLNFREITPGPTDEVIRAVREVAENLSTWVPGGREYISKCFARLEEVRQTHEADVNHIVRDIYEELRDVAKSKGSSSLELVEASWNVLRFRFDELSSLAVNQAQQLLDKHPQVRDELNGSLDRLRRLADHLGPGAKRQVDETFDEISSIVRQGVNDETAERLKKLVQSQTRELTWRSEKAWHTAVEQIQPVLERNPGVRRIVEENIGTLEKGRAKDVVEKVRQAVLSGSTAELERYIKSLNKKSQEFSSSSLSNWLDRLPSGSQILPQLQKLKEVAETRTLEGERLTKDTLDDVSNLLEQRTRSAESLLQGRPKESYRSWI